ncbi:copper homeostasis protein [Xanthomonas bromi]|uniref:Copper homeostasis protein cutC homolog n=1 Tax=Xanthomonas bromi TaxID=56449 RepID=A0A1C3NJE8_9XANT|nr:copper homeostasis protein [Xanthomonas bromi]
MRRDVGQCMRLGSHGVVLGALDRHGQADLATMRVLSQVAGSLGVTFHRALDVSAAPSHVLGCERVPTSGGRASAPEASDAIAALVRQAGVRISIMSGAGVSERSECTVLALRAHTGAHAFVVSSRGPVAAQMHAPHAYISDLGSDHQRTDVARVRRILRLLYETAA